MRDLLAVVIGGLLGTGARFAVDGVLLHQDDQFPFSTLIVNVLGAFALGYLVARVWPTAPSWLRAGLGVGLLGSFTTFSAAAVSLVSLTAAGEWMPALAYLVSTVILGLAAAWLGLRVGGARGSVPIDEVDE